MEMSNKQLDMYIFLKDGSIYIFNRVTLVININRECLLKEYKFKNKNHTRVRVKCIWGGIFYVLLTKYREILEGILG